MHEVMFAVPSASVSLSSVTMSSAVIPKVALMMRPAASVADSRL